MRDKRSPAEGGEKAGEGRMLARARERRRRSYAPEPTIDYQSLTIIQQLWFFQQLFWSLQQLSQPLL